MPEHGTPHVYLSAGISVCVYVRALGVHECASVTVHTLISQQKNGTWLIREQREQCREIRNPIQWRALFHCKCGRGHSQFQKEQVLYIRVWRDERPPCSLSYGAHARAGPDVINMDLVEIPTELNCHIWWLREQQQRDMQTQACGSNRFLLPYPKIEGAALLLIFNHFQQN